MIDREALVCRHNPIHTDMDIAAPLSVGNGAFCFTVDVTGLQSFGEHYTTCPLCTMSDWSWHRYRA